jgi:hypothetical protein
MWPAIALRTLIVVGAPSPVTDERRRNEMAIAMLVDNPDGSQQIYEKVRKQLGLDKPAGGICHIAGPRPDGGWRVIEVWESEEEAKRFVKERFEPALKAAGFSGRQPELQFWPVHDYMK